MLKLGLLVYFVFLTWSMVLLTHIKKEWLIESNAFSISTVINIPSISKELVISRTSDVSVPLSLIDLLLTYATFFKRLASTFEISSISTFRSEIGRQFLINLLSLFFFSINFIMACFWEVLNSPAIKDYWIEAQSGSLTTS